MEEKTKKTTATAGVGNAVKIYFKENLGIIVAFLVLCVFLSVFPKTSGSFFTRQNIFNVLRQISTNLFLACGMTMVIILGGIDLSVGSIIALSGCISAGCVARYNLPLPIRTCICIYWRFACTSSNKSMAIFTNWLCWNFSYTSCNFSNCSYYYSNHYE